MSAQRIAVIGAGIAGLVAARRLVHAGHQVSVLDGAGAGGAIARRSLDGLPLDIGAEGFATRGGAVLALLGELGLAADVVEPEPTGTWVYRAGKSTRIPEGAVLGIPTNLADPALEQLGSDAAARARADATLPPEVGADATTLGDLVGARMGRGVLAAWPAPLIAGVHRLDVDQIAPTLLLPNVLVALKERGSLAAALAGGGAQLAGLRGGVSRLAEALMAELTAAGMQFVPSAATALEADSHRWRVHSQVGTTVGADRVLLACPPWRWPAGVPESVAAAARAWPQPRSVDLVTLVLAGGGGGRRAGVIVADGGGRVTARALTYSSAKWGWLGRSSGERAVVRLTYDAAGSNSEPMSDLTPTDPAMTERVLADAAELTGSAWTVDDVLATDRTRWQMPRTALEQGMASHREAMRMALAEQPTLDASGGWLAGTGLAWAVTDGIAAGQRMAD